MNKKQFIVLMGKRRDVLPAGFTELEYLESSGTQYILFPGTYDPNSLLARCRFILPSNNGSISGARGVFGGQMKAKANPTEFLWGHSVLQRRSAGHSCVLFNHDAWNIDAVLNVLVDVQITETSYFWNSLSYPRQTIGEVTPVPMSLFVACTALNPEFKSVGLKVLSFAWSDNSHNYDLIPVLDANGTPCMFDKVSKQCFYNSGTGTFGYRIKGAPATFALRDPHRVAPSGVYARRAGENELEILADTEDATGEGWEWFANTAEAYEHFNIVPAGAKEL